MGWESAWERDKEAVGRAVHDGWMAEKQRQGFADHPWAELPTFDDMIAASPSALRLWQPCCDLPPEKHHPDMVPYEQLSEADRAYDEQTGVIAYQAGYEASAQEYRAAIREALAALRAFGGAHSVAIEAWKASATEEWQLMGEERRIARALAALDALAGEEEKK
jgi:hypothetical protein